MASCPADHYYDTFATDGSGTEEVFCRPTACHSGRPYNAGSRICTDSCIYNAVALNNIADHNFSGFSLAAEQAKIYRSSDGLTCGSTCSGAETYFDKKDLSSILEEKWCNATCPPTTSLGALIHPEASNTSATVHYRYRDAQGSVTQCVDDCPATKPYYDFTDALLPCVASCSFVDNDSNLNDDDTVTKKLTTITFQSRSELACVSACADNNTGDQNAFPADRLVFKRQTFTNSLGANFDQYKCVDLCNNDSGFPDPNVTSSTTSRTGLTFTNVNGHCISDCAGLHHFGYITCPDANPCDRTRNCFASGEICDVSTKYISRDGQDRYCHIQCKDGDNYYVLNSVNERECVSSCSGLASHTAISPNHVGGAITAHIYIKLHADTASSTNPKQCVTACAAGEAYTPSQGNRCYANCKEQGLFRSRDGNGIDTCVVTCPLTTTNMSATAQVRYYLGTSLNTLEEQFCTPQCPPTDLSGTAI